MKAAVFGDTHFGARNASPVFRSHLSRWLREQLWPAIDRHKCDTIIHVGDVFDHTQRRSVNVDILKFFNEEFVEEALRRSLNVFLLTGNHDVHFRDKAEPNVPMEALRHNVLITVVSRPRKIGDVLLLPWVTKDTAQEWDDALRHADAKYVFGHLEVTGARMTSYDVCDFGLPAKAFRRFEQVWSGHFHNPDKVGNITYISSVLDLNWDEGLYPHGFMIWEDGKVLEQITTPWRIHNTIKPGEPLPAVEGAYVRIDGEPDTKTVEMARIAGAADVRVERPAPVETTVVDTRMIETPKLIDEYIDATADLGVPKEKLKALMLKLYGGSS